MSVNEGVFIYDSWSVGSINKYFLIILVWYGVLNIAEFCNEVVFLKQ